MLGLVSSSLHDEMKISLAGGSASHLDRVFSSQFCDIAEVAITIR
jgi:hypothetical protein